MFKHDFSFWLSFGLILVYFEFGIAQYKQISIFPNDSSFVLINKLVQEYKPVNVLDYSNARIKMYQEIYNVHDSVSCVYTNHTLYLSPASSDPIGYLSKNGNANGINCEHSFPQSKGAENGNARSDMHHLFPARAAVNEARSNYPFGEIQDLKTDDWFYKSFVQTTIPTQQIDEYSESINGMFEPREDHKGNVARAIFYFFTMYELQADRSFFESMRSTLCDWHLKDPTDSLEWKRTYLIANYQDQKPNPFVLDCSLAKRTYCNQSANCSKISGTDAPIQLEIIVSPNPFNSFITIHSDKDQNGVDCFLYNSMGHLIKHSTMNLKSKGTQWMLDELDAGYYIAIFSNREKQFIKRLAIIKN